MFKLTDENIIFQFFADLIYKEAGIRYKEKDHFKLAPRLATLTKELKLENLEETYQHFLKKPTAVQVEMLVDLATNNETQFFRDPAVFKGLVKNILPEILEKQNSIKIWSGACSTGQEPYSLAICMEEFFPGKKYSIKASDICQRALKKAKSGHYTKLECQRGIKINRLLANFEQQEDDSWIAKQNLKNNINFSKMNLSELTLAKNSLDLIFLRNVLIYYEKPVKEKILQNVFNILKPGGLLLLGAGESMIGLKVPFKTEFIENEMWYRKPLDAEELSVAETSAPKVMPSLTKASANSATSASISTASAGTSPSTSTATQSSKSSLFSEVLPWRDEYNTKVVSIDLAHKELARLINNLHKYMEKGQSKEVLGVTIQGLENYILTKLTSETEKLLREDQKKNSEHMKEHDNFSEKFFAIKSSTYSDGFKSLELLNLVKDYFLNHVSKTDREHYL